MRIRLLELLFLYGSALTAYCDYAADEASLITTLQSNGSVYARPANTTHIFVSVVLFALNNVNIGSEVMSLSGLLYSGWKDTRLSWDPQVYNGIYKVVIPKQIVWTPPLVIENEIDKVGVLGSDGTPLRVAFTGDVIWTPPISSTTSCSADITYYPYDRQTCTITLIGWSYTVDEVDVITDPQRAIDRTYYNENGEWDLLSTGHENKNLTDNTNTYRKVLFKFTFRRKWPYYAQNIILPIILNSVLMAMVFVVPIESGEKMGYCLTVLLSYIVLLTMVSNDLPSISNQTSMLQTYLSIVLCMGTLSTVCTIGVLRIHNQDEKKPVSGWLKNLTKYVLAPVVCRSRRKSKRVVAPDENDFSNKEKEGFSTGEYGWRETAVILDRFFFVIFAGALMALTTGVILALLVHYNG